MRKSIVLIVCLLLLAQSVFALTPDKNWMKADGDKGQRAIGAGLSVGYPGVGAVVRYRDSGNAIRATGIFAFDYAHGFAGTWQPALTLDAVFEYAFPVKVGRGKYAEQGMWNIDIAPTIGFGFYFPLSLLDYFTMAYELGVTVSCDLPYKSLPLTTFVKLLYRPNLVFITNDVHMNWGGVWATIGATWNFDLK